MPRLIGILSAVFLFGFQTYAEVTLKVGDKAPAITVEKWFNGEALKSFEPGKVYVVEFWATWCGPCIEQIPHLNEIAKQYANDGVVVVGIDASERAKTPEEQFEVVANFLKTNDPVQQYLVGLDTSREMYTNWQQASDSQGIPNVYIIDRDGTVVFIDHPVYMDLEQIGNPLKQIVAGTWKDSAERKTYEENRRIQKEKNKISIDLQRRFNAMLKIGNWEGALQVAIEGSRQPEGLGLFYKRMQADLLIDNLSKPAEGIEILKGLIQSSWEEANDLSPIMELFLNPKLKDTVYEKVAREHAYQLKQRLVTLIEAGEKYDWFYYPKIALYHFAVGDIAKAIEFQKMGLAKLPEDSKKYHLKDMQDQLAKFVQAQDAQVPAPPVPNSIVCEGGVCKIVPSSDCEKTLSKKD